MAAQLGLEVSTLAGHWRQGASPEALARVIAEDADHHLRAVMVVHSETSTGVCSRIPEIRHAIDEAAHPAMLIVDAVSSVGAAEYHHDEWGVDVTISGSQKGLMLSPGLGFNAISDKALAAARTAGPAEVTLGLGLHAVLQQPWLLSSTPRRPTSCLGCVRRC